MSNEKIQGAIDVLIDQVEMLLRDVAEKKRVINSLCQTLGMEPLYHDVEATHIGGTRAIRPDQFFGKPFATAAQEFLEIMERKGACSAEDIAKGLEQGGFNFSWKEKDKTRMVAISLAKNSAVFQKLPNNTFGLLSWYPEMKKKNEAARRAEKNGPSEEKVATDEKEEGTDP